MHAPSLMRNSHHLPSVDAVLRCEGALPLIEEHGRELMVYAVRHAIDHFREEEKRKKGSAEQGPVAPETVLVRAAGVARSIDAPSLRKVINATGILLHTNLGRAPLGSSVLGDIAPIVTGYSNLEFDCSTASRGHRISHLSDLLVCLTGGQEALVVNNNAAAVTLVLHTLSQGREAVISRGELIEIGGAFRIPEIMASSGARMVEVGTTNRTRPSDYEQAITPDTALLFKAHKSNYTIGGFTEEATVSELAALAHAHHLPLVYDIGSGLVRRPKLPGIEHEPDVRSALSDGADLVTFSGDKLLGGPQSGIIAGKRELVSRLSRAPLMRALRVGKLTIAALSSACRRYLRDDDLIRNNPFFSLIERSAGQRRDMAERLAEAFGRRNIAVQVVPSTVQCGGGTLPDLKLPGFAVALVSPGAASKERESFAERIFHGALTLQTPVLGILREGKVMFDTGALFEEDLDALADSVSGCVNGDSP